MSQWGDLMKTICLPLAVLALFGPAGRASAGITPPSFDLDFCAWCAERIVVVTEGDKIDGAVEVLESWKGDCKKGDRLTVPELAAYAPEKMRAVSKNLFRPAEVVPATVSGSRVVLFLKRTEEKIAGVGPGRPVWVPVRGLWQPEMRESAAWVEAGKVFAFDSDFGLTSMGMTERQFKQKVDWVLGVQSTIAAAVRLDDPAKIAAALPPLFRPESGFVSGMVIHTLGEAGPKCLPALRGLLKDYSKLDLHSSVVWAMVAAGGDAAGPDLTELLKTELAVWKKVGPKLTAGWWDGKGIPFGEAFVLRFHSRRAGDALHFLAKMKHAGCREVVTEFRDLWRTLPSGESPSLDKLCDAVLANLDRP